MKRALEIFSSSFLPEPSMTLNILNYFSKYELLDTMLGYRFMENSGGALVAHILFQRLPYHLKEELVRIRMPYPSRSAILDDGIQILKSGKAALRDKQEGFEL